jgi:chemotaxis protein methyltransferase CheR
MTGSIHLEDKHVELFLRDLIDRYGYDFTSYSRPSLKRRISRLILLDKFPDFISFQLRVENDAEYFKRFVEQITVNVTEMFRDPLFYKTIREQILPVLQNLPAIRIWHAGCSTGEEVYSMAILLQEAGLLQKSLLFATDINPLVLEKVKIAAYPISHIRQDAENYEHSGGMNDFSTYYKVQGNTAKFDEGLRKKIILSTHNLVSGHPFNRFHFILCRNVMIYFDKELQERALNLFDESLEYQGFFALGAKETMKFATIKKRFKQVDNKEKIWRKVNDHP